MKTKECEMEKGHSLMLRKWHNCLCARAYFFLLSSIYMVNIHLGALSVSELRFLPCGWFICVKSFILLFVINNENNIFPS